jgi:hypothetical protein
MSRHFVVQLENRPGELAHLARALAARGIDIQHIAGGGEGVQAYAFLSTDDEVATRDVLHSMGFSYIDGETLVIEVEDKPGGIAAVAETLASAGVNIRSVMMIGRARGKAEIAISVDADAERVREILGREHVVAA